MNLEDYLDQTHLTANLPGAGTPDGMTYLRLGLFGEFGECCDLMKKVIRDDEGVFTVEKRDLMLKELGDLCWYLSETSRAMGVKVERFTFDLEVDDLTLDGVLVSMSPPVHRIVGLSGNQMRSAIGAMFGLVSVAADMLDSSLEEVLQMNADKLHSRLERGVISGSGDNR